LREHAKKVAALEAERLNPKPKPKAAPPANPLAPLPTQEYKVGNILAATNCWDWALYAISVISILKEQLCAVFI